MIICSCNALSDAEVRHVVATAGAQPLTAGKVYGCLGCSAQCGRCARTIKRIMQEAFESYGCSCHQADYDDAGASMTPMG
jgi:bacterioferritin-associated ferredoxin